MCPGSEASHTVNADVGGRVSCSNVIMIGGHRVYFVFRVLSFARKVGFVDLCQHCVLLFNVDKVTNFYETKLT